LSCNWRQVVWLFSPVVNREKWIINAREPMLQGSNEPERFMNLTTRYFGLELNHRIVASPSPLTRDIDGTNQLMRGDNAYATPSATLCGRDGSTKGPGSRRWME
jgi:hypothetical protein